MVGIFVCSSIYGFVYPVEFECVILFIWVKNYIILFHCIALYL